ncbi:bifunctional biotin--[acetyl-CoA-carboxylase] ligase/biotin operon repressor BirA [Pseudaeromonas pectinilytica]|jgi:birA, biotin-[acetyl-CoA-carboxylase] ligase region|nr:bifunctional biotin--[acetyl-CoA-carboxylase] ligase/biotin operon repressor BirA [Aeromonadaceae bacterium]
MRRLTERQQQLLQLLADGEFHSGEQIGQQLAISRAAISLQVKSLKALGLDIFSVTGKGYRLARPLELLDAAYLEQLPGAPIHCIAVIDSTNQYMMSRLADWQKGECLLAECQTSGRGRRGRQWVSPFAGQMIMSLYWRLESGFAAAMGLSLVVGVALAETLQALNYPDVGLKWPNDLYARGEKLAGILVEMSAIAGGSCHVVVGVGLNLTMPVELGAHIGQPWTSLARLRSEPLQRNLLTATFIQNLRRALESFEQDGLAPFVERWNRLDIYRDKPVQLTLGEQQISGVVRGINPQGGLVLERNDTLEVYMGGEISLRGI